MFDCMVMPLKTWPRDRHHQLLAAEEAPRYHSGHQPDPSRPGTHGQDQGDQRREHPSAAAPGGGEPLSLAAALAGVAEALERLAAVDVAGEADATVTGAVLAVQPLVDRLVAQQLRVVAAFDNRGSYREDGAVSVTSWLARRWRLDHGEVNAKVQAARRLQHLPALRDALEGGTVSFAHVRGVSDRLCKGVVLVRVSRLMRALGKGHPDEQADDPARPVRLAGGGAAT